MTHRDSRIRKPSWRWQRAVVACVVAAATVAVPVAATAQDSSTTPDPQELWRAFPLDATQGEGTTGGQSGDATPSEGPARAGGPAARTTGAARRSSGDDAGGGVPWLLIAALGAGGALSVAALLTLRHRQRAAGREDDQRPATSHRQQAPDAPAADPASPPDGTRPQATPPAATPPTVTPVLDDTGDREVPAGLGEPVARPGRRFERRAAGAAAASGRVGTSPRGPICQVRWSRRGTCFYAVTTDTEGVDHRLGRSPRIDWSGSTPPEAENREAQAALRVLSKQLRDKGWRPMRAKGKDFDDQQWYARRFRFPVADGEADRGPRFDATREAAARRQGSS